MFITADNMCYK